MQQLLFFLRKFRYFLLFLLLQLIALTFTIQHHSYHLSKFVNSANAFTGGIYNQVSSINDFFLLKKENRLLAEENAFLRNQLETINTQLDSSVFLLNKTNQYTYTSAKIINNNFTNINNSLTINKGKNDSISIDMGVVNAKGVIGVIKSTSKNFATVLSILNSNSRINVKLKNGNHFGTMIWNGKDYNITQLTDIPRQATIKVGDTIITGGKSAIFPEGILIGTVKDFSFENNKFQEINVTLFNDMSALGYVTVISNLQRQEQLQLELETNNE